MLTPVTSIAATALVGRWRSGFLCALLTCAASTVAFCWPTDTPDPIPVSSPVHVATAYQPLTESERWHRYWRDTLLSPAMLTVYAAGGVYTEIDKDPPEWGQGAEGWARRTASYAGVIAAQETIRQGGAAALGYDPRYLKCDCKGFFRRTGHALLWTFLTKDHDGRTRFDAPAVVGAYGSGMLSMLWYPRRYSPLTDGFRVGSQQVGLSFGVNALSEFGAELKRAFLPRGNK